MGTVDANGVYKYSASDTVSTWESFLNLGMNSVSNALSTLRLNSVYKANTMTEANALRDSLTTSGGLTPTASNPLIVYLIGEGKFLSWDGAAWKKNGDAVTEWNTPADNVLTPGTPVSGALLWGKRGAAEKYHMETGTAVCRITELATMNNGKPGSSHAYLSLKNKYTGLSTAVMSNGDAEAYNRVFSSDDSNWNSLKNADGTISKIRLICPGGKVGNLIRVNYIVVGWVQ